jgi:hypothetical protein
MPEPSPLLPRRIKVIRRRRVRECSVLTSGDAVDAEEHRLVDHELLVPEFFSALSTIHGKRLVQSWPLLVSGRTRSP